MNDRVADDDVDDNQVVVPIKVYPRPDFNHKPVSTVEDEVRYYKSEIAALRKNIAAMHDKITRMESMLQDELQMWKRGIENGEWETHEAVKRRRSRLQGAINYIGRVDAVVVNGNVYMKER